MRREKIRLVLLTAVLTMISAWTLSAGELAFFGTTDKDPLTYGSGEEMTFTVKLLEDGAPVAGKQLRWTRRGDDGKEEKGEAVSSADQPLVIKTSLDIPGFVWIQVAVLGDDGKPLHGDAHYFNGSAGVRLNEIHGFPEPADFDAFWARQKKRLAEVPMKATLTEVDSGNKKVACYDLRIDSVGAPVSGYLCLPKEAKEKSLPAYLEVHGYGVCSAGKSTGRGANGIALNINAHGIENGREPAYYQNLQNMTLKGYGLSVASNTDPETCYWNGVAMRVMRALEYLKSRPEWDGKTLEVSGGSQGGFQSLLAAGLDSDVSCARPRIPAFCDISGKVENNRTGNPYMLQWTPALGYYDGANHAKRIKGRVEIFAGLGDYLCPPSSQIVMYNNISAPVKLTFAQGQTHGFQMKDAPLYVIEKNGEK